MSQAINQEESMGFAFCGFCGAKFQNLNWPRTCGECKKTTWRDPIPVSLALVPVGKTGLLMIRRGIPPALGELALPGGHVDLYETWSEAASRELKEETGVEIPAAKFSLYECVASPTGFLLFFGMSKIRLVEPPLFFPNREVQELVVIRKAEILAFPAQTAIVAKYFQAQEEWEKGREQREKDLEDWDLRTDAW